MSDIKILYLTDAAPDYLSDDLLYGFRTLLGSQVVDYPRKDVLYRNSALQPAARSLYGFGFHCFGLDDEPIDRSDLLAKIGAGYFDAIINSSSWRIRCPTHPQLLVFDGEDHGRLNPRYINRVPLYFKRELFAPRPGIEPILFALPDFLYDDSALARVRRFHASFRLNSDVRREIGKSFPPSYSFPTWREYVADMKQSWFALSPKGAGYDCQRHYEILGQAALCIFLDARAPFLLRQHFIDGQNCLTFASAAELTEKMHRCTDPQPLIDRAGADLIRYHLASKRAEQVLAAVGRCALTPRPLNWWSRLEWGHWLSRRSRRHAHFRPAP